MAISEIKRSGVESYLGRPAILIIDLNHSRLFVQQPPKKGKGSRGLFKLLR